MTAAATTDAYPCANARLAYPVLWAVFYHPQLRGLFCEEVLSLEGDIFQELKTEFTTGDVFLEGYLLVWLNTEERASHVDIFKRAWFNASLVFLWIAGKRSMF